MLLYLKVQIFTSLSKDNYLKFQGKTLGQKMLWGQCIFTFLYAFIMFLMSFSGMYL